MSNQSLKRSFDQSLEDFEKDDGENLNVRKRTTKKSTLLHLCDDIMLEIFQYLRPLDLLYSFMGLSVRVDNLLEPYTPRFDFRFLQKPYFQCLIQTLFPRYRHNLRILRLSNAYTFGQISEALRKIDWSQITQLESLRFDFIEYEDLSKYFLTIHPLLKHLWRLSLTFHEHDNYAEKLLIDHILKPNSQSESLKTCFISGIILDLSKLSTRWVNENLRELTINLSTITDLIILFESVPNLEILTCIVTDNTPVKDNGKIKSLDHLTTLTLAFKKAIDFNDLEKILIPHNKLERLSLRAILNETVYSGNYQAVNGFTLEKLFRRFSELHKLDFFICLRLPNNHRQLNPASDDIYLFSFTSHFWLDRSIEVSTHLVHQSNLRYVYTLPFAYDTFEIIDDIQDFFTVGYPYYYANVRRLSLSSTSNFDQSIYSNVIMKFFPNIQTITFLKKPSSTLTINVLTGNNWIQKKSSSNTYPIENYPCEFIRTKPKSTDLHIRTLNMKNKDEILSNHNSKHIRHITVYEVNRETLICLNEFFPWIRILTLYINRSDWDLPLNDYLCLLVNDMNSLFSLTIYAPEWLIDQNLLANTLLNVKKHFYIKCNDGILKIWF